MMPAICARVITIPDKSSGSSQNAVHSRTSSTDPVTVKRLRSRNDSTGDRTDDQLGFEPGQFTFAKQQLRQRDFDAPGSAKSSGPPSRDQSRNLRSVQMAPRRRS